MLALLRFLLLGFRSHLPAIVAGSRLPEPYRVETVFDGLDNYCLRHSSRHFLLCEVNVSVPETFFLAHNKVVGTRFPKTKGSTAPV